MESRPPSGVAAERADHGDPTDEEILRRFLEGDQAMFGTLIERYESPLHALLYRLTGSRGAAADLFQETFLRVFENAGSFRGDSRFKTWLYAIATNLCRQRWRRRQVRDARPLSRSPEPSCNDPAPPERVNYDEIGHRIERAVDALPIEQREVFVLKTYHDMTYAEIAATLDHPAGTVKSRMRLALRKLRAELRDVAKAHDLA
jgi:RNA polymerase sigma-70 factor (ECF subfamily)